MKYLSDLLDKRRRADLFLFIVSFAIYFVYFHSVFLNINSILSSATSDSLKNYYTYVYHIKNDPAALEFTGMNYPFGEHVIYTDCQPLLTFILRCLPFTHNYLVGIMHSLIFLSFIISPLILDRVLRKLEIDAVSSFLFSIGISLLSPQFLKINAGHFALAYGCLIPLSFLFVLKYLKEKNNRNLLILFLFNTLLFLLHPYLGFCLSIFAFLSLVLFGLFNVKQAQWIKLLFSGITAGLLPLILFKLFMIATDHHTNRTNEPYGAEVMVENFASIFSPVFGPFKPFMEFFFPERTSHFEGHTYLGFFTIFLMFLIVIGLPFYFKKIRIQKETLAIFLSTLFFLLISFGLHLRVLHALGIQSASLNQFRAVCRFAWIFYFGLPVFLLPMIYHSLKLNVKPILFQRISIVLAGLLFCFNSIEANSFFKLDESMFWRYRNFFHESQLNTEEKTVLEAVKKDHPQAILPLPLFHGGSEMYDRAGSNNSMIPSMIYSYHSGIPIASVLMSRTSLNETKELIELLNSYKATRAIEPLLDQNDFFVLITKDPLLPDESRLQKHIKPFAQNDSLTFGFISKRELLAPKRDHKTLVLAAEKAHTPDSTHVVFIPAENRKPFLESRVMDYETVFVLDSNLIETGTYIVSLHYYYTEKSYRGLANGLIVNAIDKEHGEWQYNPSVRCLSGFYKGFGVFEYRLLLKKGNKYEFMLKGIEEESYHISNFMLRPEDKDVLTISAQRDTSFNNFPQQDR